MVTIYVCPNLGNSANRTLYEHPSVNLTTTTSPLDGGFNLCITDKIDHTSGERLYRLPSTLYKSPCIPDFISESLRFKGEKWVPAAEEGFLLQWARLLCSSVSRALRSCAFCCKPWIPQRPHPFRVCPAPSESAPPPPPSPQSIFSGYLPKLSLPTPASNPPFNIILKKF